MSKQAAEAIRRMIRDGNYTGWTGRPDSECHDYFMCHALSKVKPDGWSEAVNFITGRIRSECGDGVTTLSNLFWEKLGVSIPSVQGPCYDTRRLALEWFEAIAVELENLENQNES